MQNGLGTRRKFLRFVATGAVLSAALPSEVQAQTSVGSEPNVFAKTEYLALVDKSANDATKTIANNLAG
jgi:hypothetical protein